MPFTRSGRKKIPYPTLKGIKFILDEMAQEQPQARKAAPENFVDVSLLQEIEQSGFFKQLWKNYPWLIVTLETGRELANDREAQ